jgi:hypothetical protein
MSNVQDKLRMILEGNILSEGDVVSFNDNSNRRKRIQGDILRLQHQLRELTNNIEPIIASVTKRRDNGLITYDAWLEKMRELEPKRSLFIRLHNQIADLQEQLVTGDKSFNESVIDMGVHDQLRMLLEGAVISFAARSKQRQYEQEYQETNTQLHKVTAEYKAIIAKINMKKDAGQLTMEEYIREIMQHNEMQQHMHSLDRKLGDIREHLDMIVQGKGDQ